MHESIATTLPYYIDMIEVHHPLHELPNADEHIFAGCFNRSSLRTSYLSHPARLIGLPISRVGRRGSWYKECEVEAATEDMLVELGNFV